MILDTTRFVTTIEVVPPAGPVADTLLEALDPLASMALDGFSVASNPVARPRMSALALSALIQHRTGKPAVLHLTTRDHNRLSLQAELWGAQALGVETVLVATGDFVALGDRDHTSTVRDLDVYGLVQMAREAGMQTGVVFDTHPETNGLARAVDHLHRKADAGAQFGVTQPVYDEKGADEIATATKDAGIPILMGILPLRTVRHAHFLHDKVAGIAVPATLRHQMEEAADPLAVSIRNAGQMLHMARQRFAGACIMPPFDHYEIVPEVVAYGLRQ